MADSHKWQGTDASSLKIFILQFFTVYYFKQVMFKESFAVINKKEVCPMVM